MIEKLKRPVKIGGTTFREKINELVDAVNILQAQVAILEEHAHPTAKTEVKENIQDRMIGCITLDIPKSYKTDPYAEQRKWIGKVCRFFDSDKDDARIGVLSAIQNGMYFIKHTSTAYDYCEPVGPEDNIIYKKD